MYILFVDKQKENTMSFNMKRLIISRISWYNWRIFFAKNKNVKIYLEETVIALFYITRIISRISTIGAVKI